MLLLIEGLDDSYAAHILLNDVVELIVGVENALEHGVHLDDYQHEQSREDRYNRNEHKRNLAVDSERDYHGENQHNRSAYRYSYEHLIGVLNICDIRRQSRDYRRGREFVDVRECEGLNIIIHIAAQIRAEPGGRARAEERRKHSRHHLEHRKEEQRKTVFPYHGYHAALDAVVDKTRHAKRDNYLEHDFKRGEKDSRP